MDGNISVENAGILRASGADNFVGGTSSVFKIRKYDAMKESIMELRNVIQ